MYLSARSGAWFLRRVWDNGLPLDLTVFTRFISFLMRWLPDSFVCREFRKRANARFDHALYGLLPSHEITAGPAIVNDDLPSRILSGSVQVRPGIARLTSSGVQFTDGTYVDDIDAVICATGTSQSVRLFRHNNTNRSLPPGTCLMASNRSFSFAGHIIEIHYRRAGLGPGIKDLELFQTGRAAVGAEL